MKIDELSFEEALSKLEEVDDEVVGWLKLVLILVMNLKRNMQIDLKVQN